MSRPSGASLRAWRQFWQRRSNRWALALLFCVVALALGADFLACDRPVVTRFHGTLYWFPNLIFYRELQLYDNATLLRHMAPGDWALLPMVPWGYNNHDLGSVLSAPSQAHWFGTDPSGRDVLARILHGARVSLLVGISGTVILSGIGVTVGSLAGYLGRWVDQVSMRLVEILNSVPSLLVLVTSLSIFAPRGWGSVFQIAMVIGLLGWTTVARLIRGEILRIKGLDYVLASQAQGASTARVILRHLLPNAMSPVLVAATFAMAGAIETEAALSFLGFGIPADMASWGGLLKQVRGNWTAWWLGVFPGLAVFLTVTLLNLVGEGLRDAIDPRMQR